MDFLKYEFVDTLLRAVGIEQEYAFSDQIREKYFHEDQIGNLTAMTPGAIDVSRKILPPKTNYHQITVYYCNPDSEYLIHFCFQ